MRRSRGTWLNDTGDSRNEQGAPRGYAAHSLHSLLRVPASLLLAHHDNLADVVGVVRADVRDTGSPLLHLGIIGGLDSFLPIGQNLIQLLHRLVPLFGVVVVEGVVVLAAVLHRRLAFELGQFLLVPEDEVVRQLSHRMVALTVRPLGLFSRESIYRGLRRHEPFSLVVGRAQLLEQNTL